MPAPVNFFSVFRPSWEMCGRYFIKISQNGNMIFDSVRLFLTHFTVPFLKRFNEHNYWKSGKIPKVVRKRFGFSIKAHSFAIIAARFWGLPETLKVLQSFKVPRPFVESYGPLYQRGFNLEVCTAHCAAGEKVWEAFLWRKSPYNSTWIPLTSVNGSFSYY